MSGPAAARLYLGAGILTAAAGACRFLPKDRPGADQEQ